MRRCRDSRARWTFFEDYTVLENGEMKKLYCFLLILGYSRTRYIEFVTDMSTNTLIRFHANAFRYFNGYPEEILYDNMKQVVVKRLLKQAQMSGFLIKNTLEDFDFSFQPSIDKRLIDELATMRFLENAENIVFLGPSGVGKRGCIPPM